MFNKVIIAGRLGKDPAVNVTKNDNKVASFSVATSENIKDKSGEKTKITQWHTVKCWGVLADIAEKYLSKGKLVLVEGKLTYNSFQDKYDNKVTKAEITAEKVQMLESKESGEGEKPAQENKAPASQAHPEDDLPF